MTDGFMPGIYPDIPELDYHACKFGPEGSLSSHEAKNLLDCPAVYRYAKDHPQPPKAAFDFGHVVHALVLGTGLDIYVHEHESLRTKAARQDVEEHRAAGEVPVSRVDYERAKACADAVKEHPLAERLFEAGTPEQSLYAIDDKTGRWMRGRIDWMTTIDGETVLVDLKTTRDPNPRAWARQAASLDYALQAAWYRTLWEKTTGKPPKFLHVLVGVDAPHLVGVVQLDDNFLRVGEQHARRALDVFDMCETFNEWPDYGDGIHVLTPPAWYLLSGAEGDDE